MSGDEVTSAASIARREYWFWWAWLFGTLVSTVGLISFCQHVFGVQLLPTYAHGIEIYRAVVHSVVGALYAPFVCAAQYVSLSWLHHPLKITIPGWWKDLATISTINMAAMARAVPRTRKAKTGIGELLLINVFILLCGLLMLGGLMLLSTIMQLLQLNWEDSLVRTKQSDTEYRSFLNMLSRHKDERARKRQYVTTYFISLGAVLAASAFFFVTNAYPP